MENQPRLKLFDLIFISMLLLMLMMKMVAMITDE